MKTSIIEKIILGIKQQTVLFLLILEVLKFSFKLYLLRNLAQQIQRILRNNLKKEAK